MEWRLRKNIIKRIEEAYNTDKIKLERLAQLNKQLKSINYILDFKDEQDLVNRIIKLSKKKNDMNITKLYEGLSMEECFELTKVIETENIEYCSKELMYTICDIMLQEEKYVNELINNIERNDEDWV